jgi:hypothetical protein
MPTKPVANKPISGKPQAGKPVQKNVVQKKPAPDKTKGLALLKETPQASLVQKKPAPKPAPYKVENLAKEPPQKGFMWSNPLGLPRSLNPGRAVPARSDSQAGAGQSGEPYLHSSKYRGFSAC